MSFEVHADAYGRFMGRYSEPLAQRFATLVGVAAGQRALDVGCGTGALTAELIARLGAASVSAVDPSESFVAAAQARFPTADVRAGSAEQLPYRDKAFDLVLAQLVVHFMRDPVAGLREMARVARPGGTVAACVWDHTPGGGGPLSVFWRAALDVDPQAHDESNLPGAREGHLAELFTAAGLRDLEPTELSVRARFEDFEAWWEPYTLGVGPAGDYVRSLDEPGVAALRKRCAELLPANGPIEITASAWTVIGRAVSRD
ncbi:class I SAM-dependent methyltransferase [Dactylosporangium sp. CS-033363]|uniref:class I SAM-dependent methyltransferase n=1 Tax=Dactylosporangium sp. CS-033363 TaxID=3239935 RepID=UPI003D942E90